MLDDFDSHRPLAGNDCGIIVAVDVSELFFVRDLVRVRFGFSEISSVKNDGRTKFLAITYFNQRRELRHHHRRGNAEQFALISKRLSVIARGCGDHTALLLVGRELREGIARAALLETSRAL